jgi:hypothetical protein
MTKAYKGASALVDFQAHRICLQRTELHVRPNSEVRIRHFTCGDGRDPLGLQPDHREALESGVGSRYSYSDSNAGYVENEK